MSAKGNGNTLKDQITDSNMRPTVVTASYPMINIHRILSTGAILNTSNPLNGSINIADGSVATVLKENDPMSLIKATTPNTWFYAPRALRISRDGSDRPLFALARNRTRLPDGGGLVTTGGAFGAQMELAVPLPSDNRKKLWTKHIGVASDIFPDGRSRFYFKPMSLRDGKMSIQGVDQYVNDPSALVDIPVGASSTIPLSLDLNKVGADTFFAAMGTNAALPLVVYIEFKYDMLLPQCHYKLIAHTEKSYKFFSKNVKARASYWGWVGAQADIQETRESLKSSGALTIKEISRPGGFDEKQLRELERMLIDSWAKNALALMANKPELDPASAPDPGGYFGGVSVSMKSYSQVQNLDLSMTFDKQTIREETYSLSYAFNHQFEELNPNDYCLDVIEDNKLPIIINMGKDARVSNYTGQYGYRTSDGVYHNNSITDGSNILTGVIQFGVNDPMPEETEIQLNVDWNDQDWEDRREIIKIENSNSGASFTYSPGNNIARIMVVSDLYSLDPDTLVMITWRSVMPPAPDGSEQKVYSGSSAFIADGSSKLFTLDPPISFPYYKGMQSASKVEWEVQLHYPDGRNPFIKNGLHDLSKAGLALTKGALGV